MSCHSIPSLFPGVFTAIACAVLLIPSSRGATVVDLSFDSLPTAQGWTFDNFGPNGDETEAQLFNVLGGGLNQTTFGTGQGFSSPGQASYFYQVPPASILGETQFTLTWTAAVTRHEQTRQDFSYAAFSMSVVVHGDYFSFGIKPTQLYTVNNGAYFTPVGFDGTVPHTYTANIDTDANTWELFVDGVSVATGGTTFSGTDQIRLGDGTGTANADGRTTAFTLTAVPEPSALVLALGGLGLLLRRRRGA